MLHLKCSNCPINTYLHLSEHQYRPNPTLDLGLIISLWEQRTENISGLASINMPSNLKPKIHEAFRAGSNLVSVGKKGDEAACGRWMPFYFSFQELQDNTTGEITRMG